MYEHLNEIREEFFDWCNAIVRDKSSQEGTVLKKWRPRRNEDGSYNLTYELTFPGGRTDVFSTPIPERFKELLDKEYQGEGEDGETINI